MLACSNLNNFTVNGYGEVFAHFVSCVRRRKMYFCMQTWSAVISSANKNKRFSKWTIPG